MNITTNLTSDALNKIVSVDGSLGGSEPCGIVTKVIVVSEFAEITTSGECRVACATQLAAGDWFTSDADGRAVKAETGFALGRILEATIDGVSLCVVGAANL